MTTQTGRFHHVNECKFFDVSSWKKIETRLSGGLEKATRRRFTQGYTEQILSEADQWNEPGELGELLRREGLNPSNLTR